MIVASVATPASFIVTWTGSATFSSFAQPRPCSSKENTKRCARNVNRFVATAGAGEGCALVSVSFCCMRLGAMSYRVWQ